MTRVLELHDSKRLATHDRWKGKDIRRAVPGGDLLLMNLTRERHSLCETKCASLSLQRCT